MMKIKETQIEQPPVITKYTCPECNKQHTTYKQAMICCIDETKDVEIISVSDLKGEIKIEGRMSNMRVVLSYNAQIRIYDQLFNVNIIDYGSPRLTETSYSSIDYNISNKINDYISHDLYYKETKEYIPRIHHHMTKYIGFKFEFNN